MKAARIVVTVGGGDARQNQLTRPPLMTAQRPAHETIDMPTQDERMERSSWMSDAGLRSGLRAERLSGETAGPMEAEKERAWTAVLASAAAALMCALAGFVLMAA